MIQKLLPVPPVCVTSHPHHVQGQGQGGSARSRRPSSGTASCPSAGSSWAKPQLRHWLWGGGRWARGGVGPASSSYPPPLPPCHRLASARVLPAHCADLAERGEKGSHWETRGQDPPRELQEIPGGRAGGRGSASWVDSQAAGFCGETGAPVASHPIGGDIQQALPGPRPAPVKRGEGGDSDGSIFLQGGL